MRWGKTAILQKFNNPKGEGSTDFILFHSPFVCQVVLPVTNDGRVIVINQFKHGIAAHRKKHHKHPCIKELPAGGADKNEKWITAAKRELFEETGYVPQKMFRLADRIWNDPASSTFYSIPWLALNCRPGKGHIPDTTEFLEVELITVADWFQMIYAGVIVDTRSIAVSLLATPLLRTRGHQV